MISNRLEMVSRRDYMAFGGFARRKQYVSRECTHGTLRVVVPLCRSVREASNREAESYRRQAYGN